MEKTNGSYADEYEFDPTLGNFFRPPKPKKILKPKKRKTNGKNH